MAKTTQINQERAVVISAPNFRTAEFKITGTAPYVQLKFSEKIKHQLLEKMATEGNAKKGKKGARDYDDEFKQAMYEAEKGWRGIPASAFRNAIISACRTVNFKMTLAKLSVFIEADGFDKSEGTPLIKIEGTPEKVQHAVRNATGVVDFRTRAMWKKWSALVRVQYDADQFNQNDIANLLMRVGVQVGIGEGRPDGKQSAGMGWGLFSLVSK
jgi:acyl-CoA-binding protein